MGPRLKEEGEGERKLRWLVVGVSLLKVVEVAFVPSSTLDSWENFFKKGLKGLTN